MTKDQILLAAAQIISEKGFHATSMQDIAEAVDLRKASLYHHISSKQEILMELLDRALDILNERISKIVDSPLPPDEKLRQAMRAYLNVLVEHRGYSSVLLLEHRSLESKFYKRHLPRRDRFESLWRQIIEEGEQQGVFDCTTSRITVKVILGIANWTIMWFRPDGEMSADEISDYSINLILQGLAN